MTTAADSPPSRTRAVAVGAAAVALAGVGSWLATGVAPRDVLLFLGYLALFIALPGVTLLRALSREPGDAARHVAIGCGLGYAISILAYIGAGAVGLREAFFAYPLLVALPAAIIARRRHGSLLPPRPHPRPGVALTLCLIAVAVVGYLVAALFSQTPLLGSGATVAYYPDLVWGVSLAAEALHHFPMTDPTAAGESFKYHTFVFFHMASVAQVTGTELSTIAFRLWMAAALLLLLFQLSFAGQYFTGRAWAGPAAAGLFLLIGDLDLGEERAVPFMGTLFSELLLSPSLLLGLVVFVPLVVVLNELAGGGPASRDSGGWIVAAILLAGASGAKATILPVVLGGLGLFGIWRLVRTHRLGWELVALGGLTLAVFAVSYALLFAGGGADFALKPLRTGVETLVGQLVAPEPAAGTVERAALFSLGSGLSLACLMPALVALAWTLRRPLQSRDTQAWLLALLFAASGFFLVVSQAGQGQIYFLWYGFAAACLLAAGGVVAAFDTLRGLSPPLRAAAALATCALAVALLVELPLEGRLDTLFPVALLATAAAVLAVFGWPRRPPAVLGAAALAAAGGLLVAGVLDGPLARAPELVKRWRDPGRAVHVQPGEEYGFGVTPPLEDGLRWVREHSPEDSVIAVNNHSSFPSAQVSNYFYYSALSERRVVLESWLYTNQGARTGISRVAQGVSPFPRRLALNNLAVAGDRRALDQLVRRYGLRYVVIDKRHGPLPRRPPGRPVFRTTGVDVYRVG